MIKITEYTDVNRLIQTNFLENKNMGYIYIIKNENYIKIGQTLNPSNRIKQLSDSNSGGSKIEKICVCGPMYIYNTIEKIMHNHFRDTRVEGEWFDTDYEEAKQVLMDYVVSVEFTNCDSLRKNFITA